MNIKGVNKKGQVTIFVIIAIVLVVMAGAFFIFQDTIIPSEVSENFDPLEADFLNCIELKTAAGIQILEMRGGYIESPEFVAGSGYMPFSSELDFMGVDIPYWHFISGNNIEMERVPDKKFLEEELENFLEKEVQKCSFESYFTEGYDVKKGLAEADVTIEDSLVQVSLEMDLSIQKGIENIIIEDHEVEINSKLGALYGEALQFYSQEKEQMFLENYSVDFLRLYAPVDGIELTCSPKVWNANEVFEDLREAIEVNSLALKNKGEEGDYFALNLPLESDIRVINSKNWPNVYEVEPADSPILVSEPIGNQAGLGILGFCYVPYHFVYDLRYPVLIQLTQGEEVFQFPLAMIIDGNVPRESRKGNSIQSSRIDVCKDKLSPVSVNLFDSNLNPIDGNVSYECFGSSCKIGETKNGELNELFPQCVNGKVVVKKEGYRKSSTTFTTVNGGSLTAILDREYEKEIVLSSKGKVLDEKSIITFVSSDSSETIIYPEQKQINLSASNYEIKIYVYSDSSLSFPETTREECYELPVSGIGGIFGFTTEECTEITIPEQEISNVLVGGGNLETYFKENDLEKDNILEIDVGRLMIPNSLDELQINFALLEARELGVEFK